jgi:hypothetical protein
MFGGGPSFQPYLTAEEIVEELEKIGLHVVVGMSVDGKETEGGRRAN